MLEVTATDLARNLKSVLDRVEFRGEEFTVVRNNTLIANITPGPAKMTAIEALGDLYQTLSPEAAEGWAESARWLGSKKKRKNLTLKGTRNPWDM